MKWSSRAVTPTTDRLNRDLSHIMQITKIQNNSMRIFLWEWVKCLNLSIAGWCGGSTNISANKDDLHKIKSDFPAQNKLLMLCIGINVLERHVIMEQRTGSTTLEIHYYIQEYSNIDVYFSVESRIKSNRSWTQCQEEDWMCIGMWRIV